ncbi:MAG: transketolase C-terminal domain-containing protein [Bacillota bacterium]|nr:transketolase C-terminal domain-containing protein [Bacillota bacterium]
MSKPTRLSCSEALVEAGAENEKIIVLEADISKSTYSCLFRDRYPDRYINTGIAEQNMLGIAAGLSTIGFIPVVMTYAVFASMRACEQIRTSICYPGLNVKIFVSHGGVTPGSDGPTHQATEDLSMMRAIPGLCVVMPCDDAQTRSAVMAALAWQGPVYMRLTRCPMKPVFEEDHGFVLGKAITISEGSDLTVIVTGDLVGPAIQASDQMKKEGLSIRLLNMHTIKPIDEKAILAAARETGAIVTVEDNNWLGGLGGAVCEVTAAACPVPVVRVGLADTFAESGEYALLLEKYGLSAQAIARAISRAMHRKEDKPC